MKQISIICKSVNPVTEITEMLSEKGLDIRDLSYQLLGSDGVLSLVADDHDKCLAVLAEAGYSALTDETLLMKAEDKPGFLAQLSRSITDRGVDIRSLILMEIRDSDDIVAISTTDNDKVRELFKEQLLN